MSVQYFWSYTVWYVLLGILAVIELTYALVRADDRKFAFAYYLSLTGAAFHVEVFLMNMMKAYTYYPMIIPNAPFDDSLVGDVFSQISVAATALLVCILKLRVRWILLLVLLYGLVEGLFLALGIYSHNWYRTWMTLVLLAFYFFLSQKLYERMLKRMRPPVLYALVVAGLFPMYIVTVAWAFILAGYQNFSLTLLPDPNASRSLLVMLHFALLTGSMMYIRYGKPARYWSAAIVLCHYGLNYLLSKYNLMYFHSGGWYLIYTTATMLWNYFSIVILDRLYTRVRR